jgi:hypothetical protein
MADWSRESLISTYGDFAPDFLELAGSRRQRVLQEGARDFANRIDLPAWRVADYQPRELGGRFVNELILTTPVQFQDEVSWTALLDRSSSIPIDVDGLTAAYVLQRRFNPRVSRLVGSPAINYSEGILALAHSRERRGGASLLTIDSTGVKEVAALAEIRRARRRAPLPNRRLRFNAYADALVAWSGGQKVYLPIEQRAPVDLEGDEFQETVSTFRGSRWETVTLGAPSAARPTDIEPPSGSEQFAGPGPLFLPPRDWEGPDAPDEPPSEPGAPGGETGDDTYSMAGVVIQGVIGIGQRIEGVGSNEGWGPEDTASPGFGSCTRYNARDECKNCCLTTFSIAMSAVVSAGVACHVVSSVCVPCHVGCAAVELAAIAILALANGDCQVNCDRRVIW